MSTGTVTTFTTVLNPANSIRYVLDHLAEEGLIEWGEEWGNRRDTFFDALASWEEEESSFDAALKAAFHDLPNHLPMIDATFKAALFGGVVILPDDDHQSHKRSKKPSKARQAVGTAVRKTGAALNLDPSKP